MRTGGVWRSQGGVEEVGWRGREREGRRLEESGGGEDETHEQVGGSRGEARRRRGKRSELRERGARRGVVT